MFLGDQVSLGVKAHAAADEHAELAAGGAGKLLEVEETLKGVRIGYAQVVPGQNPQGSTTLQEVDQMGIESIDSALEHEGDRDVDLSGMGKVQLERFQKGVVAPSRQKWR